ncbi:glycosyltransferase family 2 protein [Pyxidicoccus sp. 3LFB2]
MKVFSIVVPVYFNEPNLPDTVPQLLALAEQLPGFRLELVFVDDGSGDNSLALLRDFQARHPQVIKVVKLTRNFGSMAAVQAGLSVATGDCVGIIAADLQDPPELFVEMISHWEKGTKLVLAVRADREEPLGQRMFSATYYGMMRRFAIPGYPKGGFDFLLMDAQVVREVNRIHEANTNLMSLIFWLGYRPVLIPYTRRKRMKGKSRWTLAKKVKLLIDSFVAFSYVPIRALSVVGLLFATGAFAYGILLIVLRLTQGVDVPGWTALMVMLALASGIQMTMLGVLGEYLWRTLEAARQRPHYVIDEVVSAEERRPLALPTPAEARTP